MVGVAERMLWTLLHFQTTCLAVQKAYKCLDRVLLSIMSLLRWSISLKMYLFSCFLIHGFFIGIYKYEESLPEINAPMAVKEILIYI